MSRSPLVSIVMPCFNAQATIPATLASILAQSHDPIEVIAVNDGSRDATPALLDDLARDELRLRVIHQANAGVSAARNAGIAAACGRFIALMDADDLWAPSHLATHVARFDQQPSLGVSFSPARIINLDGGVIGMARPKLERLTPVDFLTSNPTTTCSTLVVRREVFEDIGAFNPKLRRDEDQEWLFRVSLSRWQLAGHPHALVDYRTTPGGLASDLEGMFAGFQRMLEHARLIAPAVVAANETLATAITYRYLARRALQLGKDRQVARDYLTRTLKLAPSLLVREPRATWAPLIAVLVPGSDTLIYRREQVA